MFVRTKTIRTGKATYQYLQLVESRREGKRVIQEVHANLGRLDQLMANGSLDRLIESLGRFSEKLVVLDALRDGDVVVDDCPEWGPALIFGRLWEELGLGSHLHELTRGRDFQFDLERVAFAIALQRLVKRNTGSDRDGLAWLTHCRIDGLCDGHGWVGAQLQHFYRTVSFLGENKQAIEERLWAKSRDLYNYKVDVAFFDTTTAYFEGEGPADLAKRGKSKDGKHDCTQVVIGVVLTQDGWPICTDVWPGNMSDAKTVVPILDALKKRFHLQKLIFICDRGMVSKANLKAIVGAEYDYIVGCKLRGDKTVRERVLSRPGRYHEVEPNLRVKEVDVDGTRYVICHNPLEAERDRRAREKILAKLREKHVGKSVKGLTPNRGFKRFLKRPKEGALEIDDAKVRADERYDGKYVLRTSTDWMSTDVARAYKSLWMVERFFRDFKGVAKVRPIYHHKELNVRGHVTGCFLGLYLAVALRKRIEALHLPDPVEWENLIQDLKSIRAVALDLAGRPYLARTELKGRAHVAFRAVGVRPPPRVQARSSAGTQKV